MNLRNETAELYYPMGEGKPITDFCIAAHHDDAEIMAFAPIAACYGDENRRFGALIAADGAGSPRAGDFAAFTDGEMKKVRKAEQKKAADVGRYGILALLDYPSARLKDKTDSAPTEEMAEILLALRPKRVYIHNFADKHPTHVAAALRALAALRSIRDQYRPEQLCMLEVWRGLDWLCDGDKMLMDASGREALARDVLGVYESQIAGGKRYDLAAMGRRYANATFLESHSTDGFSAVSYGLDATRLLDNEETPAHFIEEYIRNFRDEVTKRIAELT